MTELDDGFFVGHIDGRVLGVVGCVGRGVDDTVGFLLAVLLPHEDELGKVTFPFGDDEEGILYEDDGEVGRVREYFDVLEGAGEELTIGALGLPVIVGGVLGVEGRTDGFDLLYFEGAAAEGLPFPEYPFPRSYFDASLGPLASVRQLNDRRSNNVVIELRRNMIYSLFDSAGADSAGDSSSGGTSPGAGG